MFAATILRLARTMRWAIAGSETRNAAAISWVVKPATARSVSATWASWGSAGWQQVKIRRSRSSASTGSPTTLERSRIRTFSAYRLSRRRRPDLDRSRGPCLGHLEGLVPILDLDDRKAPDDLLGLDERTIDDDTVSARSTHGGDCVRALELLAADDLAVAHVAAEPLAGRGHGGGTLFLRVAVPPVLVFLGADEHEDVFHDRALSWSCEWSTTGRISTVPGHSLAIASASSRSATSISA